jgi:hypothetical protein
MTVEYLIRLHGRRSLWGVNGFAGNFRPVITSIYFRPLLSAGRQ